MFKRLLSVGGFTLLSRIAGFGRDVVMAAILGAGPMSDAFLVAFRLPNNFRSIFGEGAFNVAFLPRFTKAKTQDGHHVAALFADRIFSWQMAAQFVLLVAALAGMHWIIAVMAPGFAAHPGQTALAVNLARIAFPFLIFTVVVVQLAAMLNSAGKFAAAAAWPIVLNITMAVALLLSRHFPNAAYAAAWGVFFGGLLQFLFMVWAAARSHLRLHITWPRWTAETKGFLLALGAATIGSASVQISLFIDNLLASFLPSGDLTALYYADRINQLPMGTLGVALATVLLPEMASRIAAGDHKGADAAQNRAAALGLFFTLPFVAAFFLVPVTIMRGLFAHGAFHLHAADLSAHVLTAYGIGLPAYVLMRVTAPIFYARGDTATPVRATLVAVAVNIAVKVTLVWGFHFGAVGIALGTAIAAWVNFGMLLFLARSRGLLGIHRVFWRSLPPTFAVSVATGAAAYAGVLLADNFLHLGALQDGATLALAVAFGAAVYAGVTFAVRGALPLGRFTGKQA